MTWWHPLWIHVDCTFYSLSWCLRHQGHLRDCLKCVLIGKQLSNNWTLSALQVNARENIAADRRVAPMADALWSPDVWTSTMTRVLCKPGLPRKYSWNILIPAWVASQVLEKHHEISAISVSFFGHVRGSGPASSWLSKQSSGEHSWHPKSQVTFSRSQHQEGLKSECKHNYMYIYNYVYFTYHQMQLARSVRVKANMQCFGHTCQGSGCWGWRFNIVRMISMRKWPKVWGDAMQWFYPSFYSCSKGARELHL